ncbi:hypothetical protein G7043_00950 [Lentzea sp. NEAU-D13]|uniref:RNA polymerase sigma-70 region 2 domain-containing protein n=1 Tax=Lentzea alba TaxID=2714351 RepID=A0A7C9VL67_9PSEU|nr:sigma factor [Lentzea alba]NGY57492.1 hypothetical protein [Lentzea alba]
MTPAAVAFEAIYQAEFDVVMAYFARRTADPQTAADLTADTFVAAITSFSTFNRSKGTARSWLLGIGRRVFAQHCEAVTRGRDVVVRMHGRRVLSGHDIDDLVGRIDAERKGRELIKEAAAALGVSSGALRIRLFRAHGKLRGQA